MRLYDYWRSSASYRVRIALAMKGVEYERCAVDLLTGEQASGANRSRNAQGFVPTLEIDGQTIGQSLAIIDYLDATWPDPPMTPREPLARARTLQRALVIAADIHPVNNLRILKRLNAMGIGQAGRDDWYRHWIAEGFAALEAMAGGGIYLGGDAPDLSDVCLAPQMYNARRLETPLDAYPRLVAIDAALNALPAFAAAHPENFRPA
ncbi:MAG: maleylacetoacetate isomerase [Proteobacteria bacterium]|nr:maleylacetoacetate isomerase [Pseudomonadota bacterium]